ncbi:MAG: bifunctional phosphoribosyl-AMP cyclohydrolase/phosphoribosyl-ATP diphosphatase HisIE [Lachnospiraceae bacterium]|nr:bifunctional phosphoribosyl-AMP cyclohydrolase/phosphoribosyl-ATP diphosphatase HisIE [Lachnospiraceae bacterium]
MKKKLIPCIYLKNKMAIAGFDDNTVIETDPLRLVKNFTESKADEILVYDLSIEDNGHEEALDVIREICEASTVPVIGAGNVKRMEDIKKLLYAGCKRACLNYSKQTNVDITKEVSDKFGKDKIVACVKTSDELIDNLDTVKAYVGTVLCLDRDVYREEDKDVLKGLKFIINLPNILLDKLIEYMKFDDVEGITGAVVNNNTEEFLKIKDLVGESVTPFSAFKLNSDGLIPVIVQDYKTNEVLMLAYMNAEAYEKTVKTGQMTYFSRSRQSLWLKGETSGHFQYVKSLSYDCDADTLLAKVEQIGAACHTGAYSCFFNDIISYDFEEKSPLSVLTDVYDVIMDRKVHPKEGSYTNYLFNKGIDKILKKVGEEATEIVIAAKNPNANEIKYEISDFLYHVMVLMAEKGVTWDEIMKELANR